MRVVDRGGRSSERAPAVAHEPQGTLDRVALEVRHGDLLVVGEGTAPALHVLEVLPPRRASLSPARLEQLAALARAELALVEPEHAAVERARSRTAPRPARGWWRACDVPALPAREASFAGWRGSGARPVARATSR